MERVGLARALAAAAPGLRPSFLAEVEGRADVFLEDPGWGASERADFAALAAKAPPVVAPEQDPEPFRGKEDAQAEAGRSGGGEERGCRTGHAGGPHAEGWLLIPSGGTSGRLKLARHDQDSIEAAVAGFAAHFGAREVCSVGVLPLHHVSGVMAWARCALTGGRYLPWDWKRLEAGEVPGDLPAPRAGRLRTISLVPTQLHRVLSKPAAIACLRRLDAVFVGGGAPWPALLDAAAGAGLPLSVGYGMTETAAMACGQLPAEFLGGDRSAGRPLPHVRLSVTGEGLARLSGASLFKGYFPAFSRAGAFTTEDLVTVGSDGRVTVLGRRDAIINTGGKKVDPAAVEAALRATELFSDLAVVGVPDPEWGQAVVLCHPAADGVVSTRQLAGALDRLSPHQRPRRVIPLTVWPRTPQGKVNRAALAAAAAREIAPR